MSIDLIIRSGSGQVDIALLKDRVLTELHTEKSDKGFGVGDIYLGKVHKVAPSLNAAFVDVGYEKDAFLHYFDLGPHYKNTYNYTKGSLNGAITSGDLSKWKIEPDIDKNGRIDKVISASQNLLVQIAKEPINTKGPRLSAEVTLAGRYAVLVPFTNKISISSRIKEHEERDRLRLLYKSIKPANCGLIIRTQASKKKVAELDADIRSLTQRWDLLQKNMLNAKAPKRVLGELDRTSAVLRDLLTAEFNNIHVDDELMAEEIAQYVERIAPEKKGIVKYYRGKLDIFDQFTINRQIKACFGRHVPLTNGAYLIVEHTEAMHVIDVNSGSRKGGGQKDQEQIALEINIEAAKEIARILRLRDMGGIVAVDFIDLYNAGNRRELHKALKEAMATDKAKHNVLAPSRFGVVEITRQRVRPETDIETAEGCPTCGGSGKIGAPILILDEMKSTLKRVIEDEKPGNLILKVHPFIHAYMTKGFWNNPAKKWSKELGNKLDVRSDGAIPMLDYRIEDGKGNEYEH